MTTPSIPLSTNTNTNFVDSLMTVQLYENETTARLESTKNSPATGAVAAVGVDGAVVVTTKRSKDASKPVSAFAKKSIKAHKKNKQSTGAKAVKTMTSGSYYRSDLTQFAIARYNALQKSLKVDGTLAKNKNKVISRRVRSE